MWRWTGPEVPSDNGAIQVWRWQDTPGELRAFSDHGGDEDWVALLPSTLQDPPSWMEDGSSFGCCCVSEHIYQDGRVICIGAHA